MDQIVNFSQFGLFGFFHWRCADFGKGPAFARRKSSHTTRWTLGGRVGTLRSTWGQRSRSRNRLMNVGIIVLDWADRLRRWWGHQASGLQIGTHGGVGIGSTWKKNNIGTGDQMMKMSASHFSGLCQGFRLLQEYFFPIWRKSQDRIWVEVLFYESIKGHKTRGVEKYIAAADVS